MDEKARRFRFGLIATLALLTAVVVTILSFGYEVEAANDSGQDGLPIALRAMLVAGMILGVLAWYWVFRKLWPNRQRESRISFVRDGRQRSEKAIRAEVEARFAQQLKSATAAERKLLEKRMKAAIKEALKKHVPPGALY